MSDGKEEPLRETEIELEKKPDPRDSGWLQDKIPTTLLENSDSSRKQV